MSPLRLPHLTLEDYRGQRMKFFDTNLHAFRQMKFEVAKLKIVCFTRTESSDDIPPVILEHQLMKDVS